MSSSEEVATCTCSHVRVVVNDSCRSVSWSGSGAYSEEMPAISWVGMVTGGVVIQSEVLCMSSCSIIFWEFWLPVECLERALGALFFTLGMCSIMNLHRRVFSFKFLSLVLEMWSSDLSPERGLWYTAIVSRAQSAWFCPVHLLRPGPHLRRGRIGILLQV